MGSPMERAKSRRPSGVALRVVIASLLALALAVTPGVALASVIAVASDGHPTHPVWYHDTTAVRVGSTLYMAWNTDHAAVEARAFDTASGRWASAKVQPSQAALACGCVDSSGTDPSRHDVPTLFADAAGRVYALYGGGTASHVGARTGPYFNAAAAINALPSPSGEQLLSVPGAAYDFEVARDKAGTNYIVGQQGDNSSGAGSLVFLRFTTGDGANPGTFDTFGQPYRILVQGGDQPAACSWPGAPPSCNVYVIARLLGGPPNPAGSSSPVPLYLVWGYSEVNLSNSCRDPSGFCNRGLYLARSLDGGATWQNAAGTVTNDISVAPIAYDDSRYQVVPPTSDVGLFKAIAVTGSYPGKPWIAWQAKADLSSGTIRVWHWTGSTWSGTTLDRSRPWNNHLVMRSSGTDRLYLWSDIATSGNHANDLYQWTKPAGSNTWTRTTLDVGPNWLLTGRPLTGSKEFLTWRVPSGPSSSGVGFTQIAVK